MKITERQLLTLINILQDSLTLDSRVFGIGREERMWLYNQIINQQNGEILIDVRGDKNEN